VCCAVRQWLVRTIKRIENKKITVITNARVRSQQRNKLVYLLENITYRIFDELFAILLESYQEILSPPGRINDSFLLLALGNYYTHHM